ncbi:hypothetical protein C2G38_2299389 [Gigaspora rosea]|uniref:Uncharacterized protein n=1 Tax=Gigaspora rosea TaxID=44941 RepID=A0A397VR07_9GLOM|nr:hypothetical protein C2G38_2299389 [Gigaspora rosea]
MSSRNAKKRANEKISTNNLNKKGRKKQVVVSPSDDLNNLLNDTTISQSTSTKKGHKKKQQEEIIAPLPLNDRDNNTQSKNKKGRKKKHEIVAPPASQIITELLKDDVPNNDDDNDGILTNGNISNNGDVFNNDDVFNDSDSFNDNESVAQDFATVPLRPISTESNQQKKSMFNSRSNNQIQNDIISSNKNFKIRTKVSFGVGDNMMNIQMNHTHNVMNNSTIHFDTIDNAVPSPFNKMTIYQLCSWLCENPNVLQLANNMNLSMQAPVIEGLQLMPSTSPGSLTMQQPREDKTKACRDFLEELKCFFLRVRSPKKGTFEELVQKIFKCELNSAEGIEWLHIATRNFGDFWNKLVNGVMDLIKVFKQTRSATGPLQKVEIITFVNEFATEKVLARWLNATNIDELKAQNSIYHLYIPYISYVIPINFDLRLRESATLQENIQLKTLPVIPRVIKEKPISHIFIRLLNFSTTLIGKKILTLCYKVFTYDTAQKRFVNKNKKYLLGDPNLPNSSNWYSCLFGFDLNSGMKPN